LIAEALLRFFCRKVTGIRFINVEVWLRRRSMIRRTEASNGVESRLSLGIEANLCRLGLRQMRLYVSMGCAGT
jgi:hypothetical protein